MAAVFRYIGRAAEKADALARSGLGINRVRREPVEHHLRRAVTLTLPMPLLSALYLTFASSTVAPKLLAFAVFAFQVAFACYSTGHLKVIHEHIDHDAVIDVVGSGRPWAVEPCTRHKYVVLAGTLFNGIMTVVGLLLAVVYLNNAVDRSFVFVLLGGAIVQAFMTDHMFRMVRKIQREVRRHTRDRVMSLRPNRPPPPGGQLPPYSRGGLIPNLPIQEVLTSQVARRLAERLDNEILQSIRGEDGQTETSSTSSTSTSTTSTTSTHPPPEEDNRGRIQTHMTRAEFIAAHPQYELSDEPETRTRVIRFRRGEVNGHGKRKI